ncbi:PadR family transcriptional regulator [Pelagibius sp. CAU 1746]|uniref:PadR family transcriptional regulator n=1 Tax=Pelagibius sp. CAU 1746 TaxID=3140370 RepID=UPI00325AEEC2
MDAKTLCLGALLRGEASGYEIKKAFEEGPFSHFHQASFGSIYPALNALNAEGLIAGRAQAQDKRPDKKLYAITAKGRNALIAALMAEPAPDAVRSDLLFILSFAHFLPPARVGHLIDQRIAWYREALDRMEDCACGMIASPGSSFVRGMGIAVYRAAADYLEAHRDELVAEISESATLVAE